MAGNLDNTGKTNTNSINIGYVQGIDTSRANINKLTHSSRDISRVCHVPTPEHHANNTLATPDHHGNIQTPSGGGGNRDVRTLLLTLQGSRAISRQNSTNLNSPVGGDDLRPVDRGRLDSVTSRGSVGGLATPRPRSHCFQVEQVDDSVLDVNSTTAAAAAPSAGQNTGSSAVQGGGMTNASFVIDMNNTTLQDTVGDGFCTSFSGNHHVGFNTMPQIIKTPPERPGVPPSEQPPSSSLSTANQKTGDLEIMEPLPEVNSDQNSSTESLEYIKPDRNQCTVTSLTPLLSRDSSDSEPEPETPPNGNNPTVV